MSPHDRDAAPGLRVHRALSSPVRTRLLEVLRGEPDLDTAGLAARLGLHINTVRTHLGLLEEAGLVEARAEERERPGRPRLLYRVTPDEPQAATSTDERGYRFLASILASYLGATTKDTSVAAERAGRAWGGFVVDKPAPFAELDPAEAIDRLMAMLEEFGFAPEIDDTDPEHPNLVLRRCPFLDVARDHQDVVCSVHLGLMRGALDELGVDVQARDLIPWARPDACVAHLTVGTGAT
jgi:predicted ArsR family transcriptional regulator